MLRAVRTVMTALGSVVQEPDLRLVCRRGTQTQFYIIFYIVTLNFQIKNQDLNASLWLILHRSIYNSCSLTSSKFSFDSYSKGRHYHKINHCFFLRRKCSVLGPWVVFYVQIYTRLLHIVPQTDLLSLNILLKRKFYWLWRPLGSIYPIIYLAILLLDLGVIFKFLLL